MPVLIINVLMERKLNLCHDDDSMLMEIAEDFKQDSTELFMCLCCRPDINLNELHSSGSESNFQPEPQVKSATVL